MTAPVLDASGLVKRFGKVTALDGVDITLPDGAFVALLGPAGAGKTTTLRTIAGLEVPDAGHVMIRGAEATALEPKDRDVAMIFDSLALYPNKTGFENIATPLRIRSMAEEGVRARVEAVANVLGIHHILARKPRTMSGGERQRIALGRALVREPAFFLLDEPLSSLDAQLRIKLRAELRRLQRDRGASFLYATPDFTEALAVADSVVMLLQGRVRQVAPPQTLYDEPADREVARFVGAPEINLVPAEYHPGDGGVVRVAGIVAPAAALHGHVFNGADARFEAGLRPEQIVVSAPSDHGANARVVDAEPLGPKVALTMNTGAGRLRATIAEEEAAAFGVGEPVHVSFALERSLCFDLADGKRLG